MKKYYFLLIGLLLWSTSGLAAEDCNPDLSKLPAPEYFQDIYADAVTLGSYINDSYGEVVISPQLDERYRQFAKKVKIRALSKMSHQPLVKGKLNQQLDFFVALAAKGVDKNTLPSFSNEADPMMPGMYYYSFSNNSNGEEGVYNPSDPLCAAVDNKPSCVDGLNALARAIEPYKAAFTHCSTRRTAQGAARLTASWQRYLDESRSQTFSDLWLTTLLEKNHLSKDYLVGPIERQWVLLHPGVVIENVSNAPDGDNMALALSVEWLGINWWDKETSPVGIPFGVSITSLYSDRPGVNDVGHGLMFHFNNRYSVGWASHGGDNGFYVTVDLLNMFVDKKAEWKKYEAKINEYTRYIE